VCPDIGVRIKLASQGVGRWAASTGVKSKFGLSASQILDLVERLRTEGLLQHLKLVHCHPGSQLHDIRRVKASVDELAHVFVELRKLGAPLDYIDVGGGLAVDYEGNTSRSMNYTLEEYAKDIVYRVGLICDSAGVAHPVIVSESGRAVSAYSSVLVFNALGSRTVDATIPDAEVNVPDDAPAPIADLASAYESIYEHNIVEMFHDAEQAYEQSMQLFSLGYLSLAERAMAERLYWAVCARIRQVVPNPGEISPELASLPTRLCDIYFANVSIFQSLPDNWAIEQQFPIMPIQRLTEAPTRTATLADITCDSDGKVDTFVTSEGIAPTLPVHALRDGEPYYFGVFIVGAYQETLGGLHNLFGDAHVVNVQSEPDGGWSIVDIIRGDTAAELLAYMQFDVDELYPNIWRDCERAVREGRMTLQESQVLRRFYETELGSYSYLRHPGAQ
jgi:arginine decarboxylase